MLRTGVRSAGSLLLQIVRDRPTSNKFSRNKLPFLRLAQGGLLNLGNAKLSGVKIFQFYTDYFYITSAKHMLSRYGYLIINCAL